MLSERQNFIETITGGEPDHYTYAFDCMKLIPDPIMIKTMPFPERGKTCVTEWGVTMGWNETAPAAMPLTDDEHKVITDVTKWREQIIVPEIIYPEEAWAPFIAMAKEVDTTQYFRAVGYVNGIFERLHYLMGIEDTLCYFYEEPEAMHELIDFLTDFEIENAKELVKYLDPELLYHHDDWGFQRNSIMSPEMFGEFLVPAYKRIYGWWKENSNVQYIVHHNDTCSGNLVPQMIEVGIDVWQAVIMENDIPGLLKKYGGQIAIMGEMNCGIYDKPDTTYEQVEQGLREMIESCPDQGKRYIVHGLTYGGPACLFKDVDEYMRQALKKLSAEYF